MDNVSNRGWVRENILPIIAAIAVIVAVIWIWYDYDYRTAPVDNFSSYQSQGNLPKPASAQSGLVSTNGWSRVTGPQGIEIPYPSGIIPHKFSDDETGFARGSVENEFFAIAPILVSIQGQSPEALKNSLIRQDFDSLLTQTTENFDGVVAQHFTGRAFADDRFRPGMENGYIIFPYDENQSVIIFYYAEDGQMAEWARAMAATIAGEL